MKRKLKFVNTPRIFSARPKHPFLLPLYFSFGWLITEKFPNLAHIFFRLYVDERFFEYPYVYSIIGPGNKKILDIGCWGSLFPIKLASLGHEVYGIDIQDFHLKHQNFHFVKGDACNMDFPDNNFDFITAISSIEHFGLGRYTDPKYDRGDKKAVKEISRCLKPGGKAIIAVPFGKREVVYLNGVPSHQIYDSALIKEVFGLMNVVRDDFFIKDEDEYWHPVKREIAEKTESEPIDVRSIAMLVLEK